MCWSSYRHDRFEDPDRWVTRRPVDDLVSTSAHVRVSDAERQQVVELLKQHTAEGRLTLEEFEERVGETLSARTGAELRTVLRDLPVAETERRPRRSPRPFPRLPVLLILVAVLSIAVGHVVIWPLFVACFWLPALAGRHRHARDWHGDSRTDSDDVMYV